MAIQPPSRPAVVLIEHAIPLALKQLGAIKAEKAVHVDALAKAVVKLGDYGTVDEVVHALVKIARSKALKQMCEFVGGTNDPRKCWIWFIPPAATGGKPEEWKA